MPDPLTQLMAALDRYYAKHGEPRSMVDAPREPLAAAEVIAEENARQDAYWNQEAARADYCGPL